MSRLFIVLLVFILLNEVVYGREKAVNDLHQSRVHINKLRKELYSHYSTNEYIEIRIWYEKMSIQHLEQYFHVFQLLKFAKSWLTNDQFDVSEESESIYERFVYRYGRRKNLSVTILMKLRVKKYSRKTSIQSATDQVNQIL